MNLKECKSQSRRRFDTACGKFLLVSEFFILKAQKDGKDTFDNLCKECRRKVKYRYANKPEIKRQRKVYGMSDEMKLKRKLYARTPKAKQRRNEYEKKKRASDPVYKLKHNIRTRTNNFLRGKGIFKNTKMEILIGCSWQELHDHIENNFLPKMTWKNHGRLGWHVDHIDALSAIREEDLDDMEKIKKFFHYSNLRPLWYDDNIRRTPKRKNKISEAEIINSAITT